MTRPGSPEARAILAAWIDSRCRFVYTDFLRGRCSEEATEPDPNDPDAGPVWCVDHAKGMARKQKAFAIKPHSTPR
jgi:hypothetical protein